MPKPVLDFWFEFSSVYSFLAAMRIAPLADGELFWGNDRLEQAPRWAKK